MSGCIEGTLVDLSEPETIQTSANILDSLELFRKDGFDQRSVQPSISFLSLKTEETIHDESSVSLLCQNEGLEKSPELNPIDSEVFDFDLPMTPVTNSDKSTSESPSTQDDEEEVFFGPVKYRERIAATQIRSATKNGTSCSSPFGERHWDELAREANKVVRKLRRNFELCDSKSTGNEENTDPQLVNLIDCDIIHKESKPICDLYREAKLQKLSDVSEGDTGDKSDTPSKRHNRSLTYTLDNAPLQCLADEVKQHLPVIDIAAGSVKETHVERVKAVSETKEVNTLKVTKSTGKSEEKSKPRQSGLSRLRPPSFRRDRSSMPVLQKRTSTDNSVKEQQNTLGEKEEQSKPTCEQLTVPHGQPSNSSSTTKSRLSLSRSGGIPTANNSGSKLQASSAGKGNLPRPTVKGIAAPSSKLQLMKPSGLQRPSGLVKPGDSLKKAGPMKVGPMKAFLPAAQQHAHASTEKKTPAKVDKYVKRTKLSASFSTPSKSSSSIMDSPADSLKNRRSGLPTPTKSRTSSYGCIPSPCPLRGSSTSSVRSLDSPSVNSSTNKRRTSSIARSVGKSGSLGEINDKSPSSMKAKRPLVVNTPTHHQKKKVSEWSPVKRKRPIDQLDEVTRCTKKFMK